MESDPKIGLMIIKEKVVTAWPSPDSSSETTSSQFSFPGAFEGHGRFEFGDGRVFGCNIIHWCVREDYL